MRVKETERERERTERDERVSDGEREPEREGRERRLGIRAITVPIRKKGAYKQEK